MQSYWLTRLHLAARSWPITGLTLKRWPNATVLTNVTIPVSYWPVAIPRANSCGV